MTGALTAALVAVIVAVTAGSYAYGYLEGSWPRIAAWARWRAARPRFDSSVDYRRRRAIWKEQRP